MTRAILPNFGFEYEISGRAVPKPARALEERYATLLRLVPGWEDAPVFAHAVVDDLLCWGWSERAHEISGHGPALVAVRTANDKTFSHQIEQRLGIALPQAGVVDDVNGVRAAAAALRGPWILKHPFGVAGRDQLRGEGFDEMLAARIARMFETSSQLVFEPLMPIDREFSVQLDCEGVEPTVVGVTRLLTDTRGTFRGNATDATIPMDVMGLAIDAARLVMDVGYRGPLGIDGFESRGTLRAISEINARWTFGRLALELANRVGRDVVWYHGPAAERPAGATPLGATPTGGCWLLPEWCDPAGVSGTWIEVLEARR